MLNRLTLLCISDNNVTSLDRYGPKIIHPTSVKGGLSHSIRSLGRSAIFVLELCHDFFSTLHKGKKVFLTVALAEDIQYH